MLYTPGAPEAIFSGYSMSFGELRAFALSLDPGYAQHLKTNPDRDSYLADVGRYIGWRMRLPEDTRKTVPTIKFVESTTEAPGAPARRYFFATRWVPVVDSSNVEDYALAARETEEDRVKRDEFVALIRKEANGHEVDITRLRFETMKYTHPVYDYTNY
ncbi:hypothetical protein R3P38DRAFT_1646547 [Favolaschia claudopus]|uniref:Uncharacterized protein n=1 Tax=Favolaschia claudopus TaxID=2862362 RepID=A0AAW0DM47_9AGAR